jgi:ribosomal protein S18 acetylase RimI-like enzyme
MISRLDINNDTIHILSQFLLDNPKSQDTFRYFKTRNFDCLKNHIVTRLYYKNDICIGYGHLDLENCIWLGICVADEHQGKGYGNFIMDDLLSSTNEDIFLTVDKENISALNLYKKKGFIIEKLNESNILMIKKNN